MKTKLLTALALTLSVNAAAIASDFVAPEMTANQPGFNAASNAGVYAGKGLIGAVTVGNYNIKGIDANGASIPSDLSLDVLLATLHYNTDITILGGKYSFGATLVSGGLYPGDSEKDMNGNLLSVSRNPWVTPIKINWSFDNDWHVATNYTFRLGQKEGNTNTDKTYDVHQIGLQATWNINDHWQANFASNVEYRSKDLRAGNNAKPGSMGYFESSIQYRFDNGMNLGSYVYHVRHLEGDRFSTKDGMEINPNRSELTGVGVEWGMPIKALGAALNVRVFTEPQYKNHMHGVRAFVGLAKKF